MKSDVLHLLREAKKRLPAGLRPVAQRVRQSVLPYLGEAVYREREVQRCFHPPMPNNYVHLLIPRKANCDAYLKELHQGVEPLNQADGALLEAVRDYLEKHPAHSDLGLLSEFHRWELARRERRFLDGTEPVEKIFWILGEKRGAPLADWLAEHHPHVLRRFLDLGEAVAGVHRINIYAPAKEVPGLLKSLMGETVGRPKWEAALERVEVARSSPLDSEQPAYPVCILYLDREYVQEEPEVLPALRLWLSGRLSSLELAAAPREMYANFFHENASETEGFRLYKRYLAALCRLDAVYDAATGYARRCA